MVRKATDRDDVADAQRVEQHVVAGDQRDAQRSFDRSQGRDRRAVDANRTFGRRVQAGNRAQQRRLPDAVAPQYRDQLAGREARVQPVEQHPAADVEARVRQFDHRGRSLRR